MVFSNFVAANFFKKVSRSPRGFLLRPLLRAGESVTPPPLPQKNSGGAHHFRFRFLDLCIIFGKIISKVCEGFNSGAKKLDTNSDFEDEFVSYSMAPKLNQQQTFEIILPNLIHKSKKRNLK